MLEMTETVLVQDDPQTAAWRPRTASHRLRVSTAVHAAHTVLVVARSGLDEGRAEPGGPRFSARFGLRAACRRTPAQNEQPMHFTPDRFAPCCVVPLSSE